MVSTCLPLVMVFTAVGAAFPVPLHYLWDRFPGYLTFSTHTVPSPVVREHPTSLFPNLNNTPVDRPFTFPQTGGIAFSSHLTFIQSLPERVKSGPCRCVCFTAQPLHWVCTVP